MGHRKDKMPVAGMDKQPELSRRALEKMRRDYCQAKDSCETKAAKISSNASSALRELESRRLLALCHCHVDVRDPKKMRQASCERILLQPY